MKVIIQAISCFLCCLLTMLILCSCQTEAANNNDNQKDKKLLRVAGVAWVSKVHTVLALAGFLAEDIDTIVDAVEDDLA